MRRRALENRWGSVGQSARGPAAWRAGLVLLACCIAEARAEPWVSVGPLGGSASVRSIAIAPSQPSTVFVECTGVGVYATTDSGTTWTPKGYFVVCGNVCDLEIHGANPNVVLALEGSG